MSSACPPACLPGALCCLRGSVCSPPALGGAGGNHLSLLVPDGSELPEMGAEAGEHPQHPLAHCFTLGLKDAASAHGAAGLCMVTPGKRSQDGPGVFKIWIKPRLRVLVLKGMVCCHPLRAWWHSGDLSEVT